MTGPARLATNIAVGLVIGGFAVIFLAWSGAAERDFLQGQFPYLLSGGLTGLGLVVGGASVLLVQVLRQLSAEYARDIGQVADALDAVVAGLGTPSATGAAARPAPLTLVSPAGPAATRLPEGALATVELPRVGAEDRVVLGRSSYHRATCRVVADRGDLPAVPKDAVPGGLSPCRVCRPA